MSSIISRLWSGSQPSPVAQFGSKVQAQYNALTHDEQRFVDGCLAKSKTAASGLPCPKWRPNAAAKNLDAQQAARCLGVVNAMRAEAVPPMKSHGAAARTGGVSLMATAGAFLALLVKGVEAAGVNTGLNIPDYGSHPTARVDLRDAIRADLQAFRNILAGWAPTAITTEFDQRVVPALRDVMSTAQLDTLRAAFVAGGTSLRDQLANWAFNPGDAFYNFVGSLAAQANPQALTDRIPFPVPQWTVDAAQLCGSMAGRAWAGCMNYFTNPTNALTTPNLGTPYMNNTWADMQTHGGGGGGGGGGGVIDDATKYALITFGAVLVTALGSLAVYVCCNRKKRGAARLEQANANANAVL